MKEIPKNVKIIFDDNFKRIKDLDWNNPEYNIILNYLKWMVSLPFGIRSEDNFNLLEAKKILNEDHYGI